MSWPVLLLALGAALALRLGFLSLHLPNMEPLWYDYERRGVTYRLAQSIDLLTILSFGVCAFYALWTLNNAASGICERYGIVFVAWFGMALLGRLAVHRFPRTNDAQRFLGAKVSLVTNVVLAVLTGLAMVGVTAVYFWVRG